MIKLKKILMESVKLPWHIDYTKLPMETFRSDPFWISPSGNVFDAGESHGMFAKSYLYPDMDYGDAREKAILDGWVRLRTHPTQGILEVDFKSMNGKQKDIIKGVATHFKLKIYKGRLN